MDKQKKKELLRVIKFTLFSISAAVAKGFKLVWSMYLLMGFIVLLLIEQFSAFSIA